jgi:dimethylargininase
LPKSFSRALQQHAPSAPIDVALAEKQHQAYTLAMRALVPRVIELPADEALPDCCFIEDTAVIVGRRAAVSFLGALERRGEERAVRDVLGACRLDLYDVQSPATVDGGDVLFTGKHLIVGLSLRTNEAGARCLADAFGADVPVLTVPVQGTLHLKSVMSSLDEETLLFGDCDAGRKISETLESKYGIGKDYSRVWLPDPVAANVIPLGSKVLVQSGFPRSEAVLKEVAGRTGRELVKLQMSELIKADGALTCCSLLF